MVYGFQKSVVPQSCANMILLLLIIIFLYLSLFRFIYLFYIHTSTRLVWGIHLRLPPHMFAVTQQWHTKMKMKLVSSSANSELSMPETPRRFTWRHFHSRGRGETQQRDNKGPNTKTPIQGFANKNSNEKKLSCSCHSWQFSTRSFFLMMVSWCFNSLCKPPGLFGTFTIKKAGRNKTSPKN